jgi:hypothetical protein
VEADVARAARIVATMETDLVVAGLSRHVRVFDVAALLPPSVAMTDLEPMDDPAPDALACEVGGYAVHARREESWDAIVTLLTTLASDHPSVFDVLMGGCRRLSDSPREIDGLDDLLSAPDQILHDLSLGRDDRRTAHGYVTPADARAFLRGSRLRGSGPAGGSSLGDPIVAAFLRSAESGPQADDTAAPAPDGPDAPPTAAAVPELAQLVVELLDALDLDRRPRALLADPEERSPRLTRIRRLMAHLEAHDEHAYSTRHRELAFLANALVSGCSLQSRALTPREGMDVAVAVCNLGLEQIDSPLPDLFLADHDLVAPFAKGWATLFDQVSLPVSRALLRTLETLQPADPETRTGLADLGRELASQCEAGTPWMARDALDVLATLDVTVWASLLGLLDECPVIPAAMTAILERRTAAVSAMAFDLISTTSQIDAVRAFVRELPRRLRG